MRQSTTPGGRLRIGEWIVDPSSNALLRADRSTHVEPKAMEVLVALARAPGVVHARDVLLASVWAGTVVGDEALTQTVIKLRRALGDDPRRPVYIETIAKRGYRLVAEVAPIDAPPATVVSTRAVATRSPAAIAAVIALVLLLAGAALYALPGDDEGAAAVSPLGPRRSAPAMIAVAPFDALGTAAEAALARGLAEELAAVLATEPALAVVRATSASDARGVPLEVSGTVHRAGDRVRVHVRLVERDSGRQLWSARFERVPGDPTSSTQDAIVRAVREVLPERIADAARAREARRYTDSVEGFERFEHGRSLFLVRQPDENAQARALYRQAVDADPDFARAYAGLAMTYAIDGVLRGDAERTSTLTRARTLADTARMIDPRSPEVHWARAFVDVQARRHDEAIASLRTAIRLDPSFADAYAFLGGIYTYVGQPARTIPLLRTALRLDPDGGSLYYLLLGRAYLYVGDAEQALINLREAAARNPVNVETRVYLAAALQASGDDRGAAWEAEEIRALAPGFALARWLDGYPMTSASQRATLARLLAPLALEASR